MAGWPSDGASVVFGRVSFTAVPFCSSYVYSHDSSPWSALKRAGCDGTGVDGHRLEDGAAEGGGHGDVRRVAAAADDHPAGASGVVARVEGPPSVAEPDFHPRGEIHRSRIGWHVDGR